MDRKVIRDALKGGYILRVLSTVPLSFALEEDQTFETISDFEEALVQAQHNVVFPRVRIVHWRLETDDLRFSHDGFIVLPESGGRVDFCRVLENCALTLRRTNRFSAEAVAAAEALFVCAEVLGEERDSPRSTLPKR